MRKLREILRLRLHAGLSVRQVPDQGVGSRGQSS